MPIIRICSGCLRHIGRDANNKMTTLLELREKVISIYSQYENYINLAVRFLIALLALVYINSMTGYQETLAGIMPTFILALIATLLPANLVVILLGLIILVHLYALAMEAAAVGAILFLVLLLVYFRFTPGDTVLLLLFPSCRTIGLHYALPIAGGLMYSPASGVTVAVGVIADSYLRFVHQNETAISSTGTDTDSIVTRLQFLMDGIMQDKSMLVTVIAVTVAAIVVYAIRRLPIRSSWTIASGVGSVLQLLIILVGAMNGSAQLNVALAFFGVLAGFGVGMVLTFLFFNLDYTRVENTQFEDDDYYYYVKAIPKNAFSVPRRTVKTINSRQGTGNRRQGAYRSERQWKNGYVPEQQEWADSYPQEDAYGGPTYEELPPQEEMDEFREEF